MREERCDNPFMEVSASWNVCSTDLDGVHSNNFRIDRVFLA